jgi:hypothetical protein
MQSKAVYWLRWLLFPFAALPGVLVLSLLVFAVFPFEDGQAFELLGLRIDFFGLYVHFSFAFNAFLTVYLAHRIAPAWKSRAALLTYLFWVLGLSIFMVLGAWFSPGLLLRENFFMLFPRLVLLYVLLMGPAIFTGWLGFWVAQRRTGALPKGQPSI